VLVATLFGAGRAPVVPGTFGTLAAVPPAVILSLWLPPWGFALATVVLSAVAIGTSGEAARTLGLKDPRPVVIDEAALTNFDRQMQRFIDRAELVPMRLTTGANLVGAPGGPFQTLLGDSLRAAYVDLDDILADDDFSFRSDLVHFLTERFSVQNYARRIGAEQGDPAFISQAEFQRGHRLGKNAEAALLQEFFNDPSIQFNYEETLANGSWLNNFTSRDHGYQVFQVVRGTSREIAGGENGVQSVSQVCFVQRP